MRRREEHTVKKMVSPVNKWENLKIAKLMKMTTVVQQAKGLVMTVLFKACVSFDFRAMKGMENSI